MSTRTIIVVVLALVCGLCAAVGIQGMRKLPSTIADAAPAPAEMDSVVVVVAAVDKGVVIKEADVELKKLPKEFVPPGALSQLADVVERRVVMPLVKGDVVIDRMLFDSKQLGLGPRIQKDWRAFTIMLSGPSSSLAGALERGDRVDVLFTRNTAAGPGGTMVGSRATILLQNVEVLAVHPKDEQAIANKIAVNEVTSATLKVSLHDAATLDQAQSAGTLHLVLRTAGPTPDKSPAPDDIPPPRDMARRVDIGKRAFTIQAPSLTAMVAGFVLPKDYVDILHTPKSSGGATGTHGQDETKTILERVQVLAVHTKVERPPGQQFEPLEILSITLQVDPQEAERLESAQHSGTLGLALRNPEDTSSISIEAAPTPVEFHQRTRTLRGTRLGTDRFMSSTETPVVPAPKIAPLPAQNKPALASGAPR